MMILLFIAEREARLKQEADDVLPIDREWLMSFNPVVAANDRRDADVDDLEFPCGLTLCIRGDEWHTDNFGNHLGVAIKTRGQFRKLLEALEWQ